MGSPGRAVRGVIGIVSMVMAVGLGIDTVAMGADLQDTGTGVTIQIHDYARVPSRPLARAVDLVSRFYQKIGVRTVWFDALSARDIYGGHVSSRPAAVTIIILTPEMASRGQIPDAVLAYAAVPDESEDIGHIAFVIYDRVRQVVTGPASDAVEPLGVVIAHELGHLLLPHGAHTEQGLMRGHWEREDFSCLNRLNLEFSSAQAAHIRGVLAAPAVAVR
jgi:hypothetical protein